MTQITYNYDSNVVEMLRQAAELFEIDMGNFEQRKPLLSQRTMNINTHRLKDKVCAIKDRIGNCVLYDNDVVAAKIMLEYYKSSMERIIGIKKQVSKWTLDVSHLEEKLPLVDAEIKTILALFSPPDFDLDITRED